MIHLFIEALRLSRGRSPHVKEDVNDAYPRLVVATFSQVRAG
jgi:hypothetical protein